MPPEHADCHSWCTAQVAMGRIHTHPWLPRLTAQAAHCGNWSAPQQIVVHKAMASGVDVISDHLRFLKDSTAWPFLRRPSSWTSKTPASASRSTALTREFAGPFSLFLRRAFFAASSPPSWTTSLGDVPHTPVSVVLAQDWPLPSPVRA